MKLKAIVAVLFSFTMLQAQAQRPGSDKIQTNKGSLSIMPIKHASMVLNWNNKTIYVDPTGGAEAYKGMPAPDLILITDIHGDHLDKKTLAALDSKTAKVVAPQAVADSLSATYKNKLVVLANGQNTMQLGIRISAVPMYNLPASGSAFHPKGRGNGYILELGGKRVYIAGDTEATPEMRSLQNIDVAFVPMNLPYTMDIDQAAEGVLAFKPGIVYPYHFRGQNGFSDVEAFKEEVNAKNKDIEVRLLEWYPQAGK